MKASWLVPGRVEVLGKHTDYAGGNVLVCAADHGVTAEGSPCPGQMVFARSDGFEEPIVLQAGVESNLPAGHWGRYIQTVLDRLTENFGPLKGANLEFTSDLPMASGMSSSSALVVAAALVLADLNDLRQGDIWQTDLGEDRLAWATYLAAVENGRSFRSLAGHAGVGTLGGSEDHTAMLCGTPNQLALFGFSPVGLRKRVPWPSEWTFVVAVSGVTAEKTGAARDLYNRASLATREALGMWNSGTGRSDPSLAAAIRSDEDATARLMGMLGSGYLRNRVEHFVTESEVLVPQAADALEADDLNGFAEAATESQRIADSLLGNQIPQTVSLAAAARDAGALAASSFGAGFGGSVWAMVQKADADAFSKAWIDRYSRDYPEEAAKAVTVVTAPSAAATQLS